VANTKDQLFKLFTGFHKAVFSSTKGRLLGRAGGMPVVMLTTTGRNTGKKRTTMLTSPVRDGERLVLVASYGGDNRHPAWFLNLRENPAVEVMTGGSTRNMRARVATSKEKAELWPKVTARYRNYEAYQKRTTRDIPLVLLEPA